MKEEKPNALVGIADKSGKSQEEIDKIWSEVLADYEKSEDELSGEDYGILIGKVKDKAGIKESFTTSDFLKSNKSAKEFLNA